MLTKTNYREENPLLILDYDFVVEVSVFIILVWEGRVVLPFPIYNEFVVVSANGEAQFAPVKPNREFLEFFLGETILEID